MLSRLLTRARASSGVVAAFSLLFASLTVVYWTQSWPQGMAEPGNTNVPAKPTVHLDGVYYYAFLRSLYYDHDLNFDNDYELLGDPLRSEVVPQTGRRGNVFTVGPAIFWAPSFLVADIWSRLSGAVPADGASPNFQRFVLYSSCVYGFLHCVLCFLIARRAYRTTDALLASIAALVATPLYWHMVRQACYSHAIAAFLSALLVILWMQQIGSMRAARWFGLGLVCGLGMSVRAAAVAHAWVPAFELLPALAASVRQRDRSAMQRAALASLAFAAGTFLGFLPQMLVWKALYGAYFTTPQGEGFMQWGASRYGAVLFSSWNGWAAWHPLVNLGLLGLLITVYRRTMPATMRKLAAAGLLVIATHAYLNGATWDWYGGWAFGGRRFTDCAVYVAVGVAQAFSLLGDRELRVALSRALRVAIPATVTAFAAYCSLHFGSQHLTERIPLWGPVSLIEHWKLAVTDAMDAVYELTGNWGSVPANWWYALSGGVSPARFDAAYVAADKSLQTTWLFRDSYVGLGGFKDVVPCAGGECRVLPGRRGTFGFFVRTPEDLHAKVEVAARHAGTKVRLSIGGDTVLDAIAGPDRQAYGFALRKEHLRAGPNFVKIEQTGPRGEAAETVWYRLIVQP